MPISILENIVISDADIDNVEVLLRNVRFDQTRRQIIKCLETTDIQAFPGSGKTTVLIAKLAILAKKWPYTHRGICVLSHTNVARDNIEENLGKTEIGTKLLSYPHYIATMHSFFNSVIGIPWLRSNGYPIALIDTDLVLARRWKMLKYGTRSFLEHSGRTAFACESTQFPVGFNIGCGENTPSYKDIKRCAEQSFSEGYFTFSEMLLIAKYALAQCPTMSAAIQTRFPVLFIDEAQDTNDVQWELISKIFSNDQLSIRQAFGDANQAIFQTYGGQQSRYQFPSKSYFTMPTSHRFGPSIAKLADSIAMVERGLVGEFTDYARNDTKHTIFLFDKTKIGSVLEAYAIHILECFSDQEIYENSRLGCFVVGMVHSPQALEITHPHFPKSIRDYWSSYEPNPSMSIQRPGFLIDYFRFGQAALTKTQNYSEFVEYIASALRRIINHETPDRVTLSGKAIPAVLSTLPVEARLSFRKEILSLVNMPLTVEAEWQVITEKTKQILLQYFGISFKNTSFLLWNEVTLKSEENYSQTIPPSNIYQYVDEKSGRKVPIKLASIHAVKGRTHLATMVVETYWNAPNIKSILPWLTNQPTKKPGQQNETRLKCHYVSLTRARGLLCIALPNGSLTDDQTNRLKERGWNIVVL